MRKIESRQNSKIKDWIRLGKERKYREKTGYFLCEGRKMLEEARQSGQHIGEILLCDPALGEELDTPETPVYLLPETLLRQISEVKTPQNLVFTCQAKTSTLEELEEPRRLLILDGLQDPGNLGTILRCADAFALDGVVLLPGCADLYNPKVVRSTMGAVFRVKTIRSSQQALLDFAKEQNLPLYATALAADSQPVTGQNLSRCGVVIGNEGNGVSSEMLAACQKKLIIPMPGRAESLNASVAAAIMMWEMMK
jgi:TrmH family RNA methyltransferase